MADPQRWSAEAVGTPSIGVTSSIDEPQTETAVGDTTEPETSDRNSGVCVTKSLSCRRC